MADAVAIKDITDSVLKRPKTNKNNGFLRLTRAFGQEYKLIWLMKTMYYDFIALILIKFSLHEYP